MKMLDIALKDLVRSARSMFAIGMMVVAPLLITGLIYFGFGGMSAGTGRFNLPDLRVAVVNHDRPADGEIALGRMLVDYLRDERMPAWLRIDVLDDEAAARAAVERRAAGVALLIPPDFSRALAGPQASATLTLVQDPTLTIGPRIVQDLLATFSDGISGSRIALAVVQEQADARGVALDPAARAALAQQYAAWFADVQQNLHHSATPLLVTRPPLASGAPAPADQVARMMAGIMAGMLIFFAFFTGANAAQSILREGEEGTLARLFTTPTARSAILGGKFVSVFVTVAVQALVLLVASALAFGIVWGRPAVVALAAIGLVVSSAGFGLLVVSLLKSMRQSGPILGGVLSATGMLGGLFTASMSMPAGFQSATLLVPQGWAMRSWRLVLDGGDAAAVLPVVLVELAIGAACFAVGAILFRRRFAHSGGS